MTGTPSLPAGFDDLEVFARRWGGVDFAQRMDMRHGGTMEELRSFYEAMVPRLPAIFDALRSHPMAELPAREQNLFNLLMATAHVAHAVERHGQPMPAGMHYPYALKIVEGLEPA